MVVLAACDSGASRASTTEMAGTTEHSHVTSVPTATVAPSVELPVTKIFSGEVSLPEGFTVPAEERWVFDPDADTKVTVSGNVIVEGVLEMRPRSGEVEHALIFEGVDESGFVGGGLDPVESDVGLWVMGNGQLLIEGEEKTAWSYEFDPAWEGDEVVATPYLPGEYTTFEPVSEAPPPNELGYRAELLNLSRNVRIEGTPDGFTHVFIRSTRPQTIRYAALRYVAPAFSEETDRTGRYGIHFHMAGDGSRGSIVEGVVVRDAGNHAFVPHGSHGITFRSTIAYHVMNEAYWWDPNDDDEEIAHDSHDILWERAVAAGIDLGPGGSRYRLAAFFLGDGANLVVRDSVAVGVQGESGSDRAGFIWPEAAGAPWTFEGNLAHNNDANGIFVWQNISNRHDTTTFTAYYNAQAGIEHGAYSNAYQYRDLTLLGNGVAIHSHALGEPTEGADTQTWADITSEGGGLFIDKHARPGEAPVRFLRCDLGKVMVADGGGDEPGAYDFVDCGLEPEDFDLTQAHPGTVIRVQRGDGSAYRLGVGGSVEEITTFYTEG